jgi:PAS domain-containing protein
VKIKKKEFMLYAMIAITLVIPLMVGLYLQSFALWKFVSIPLHSTMESIGGVIAFILSVIIFMMYQKILKFNQFHRASFALLSMGVFDIFHAIVYPGELFVWLHSMAIFFGGLLFSFVWVPDTKVSRKVYFYLPTSIVVLSILLSVVSILFPSIVPQMLTSKKEFTETAYLLNMVGGVLFVVASFYFIKNYLKDEQLDDLLFAGHAMLFGSAGVLFFFSSLWDISWWFWHCLRLLAYVISLYFILHIYYKNMKKLESSNELEIKNNNELNESIKLLKEYKSAIYEGSIISIGNLEGRITYVNEQLLSITGYRKDELIGKPHNILRDPNTPKSVFKEMW